ncbi:MAG: F0F1 ATP synthase subunit B [Bacteroidota bacterium]|nr:F0F1 ATP synthase subunit B [Bacteroidota bacterium]
MSILSPEPGLLFWMLLTFGIVFFILAKYGFPIIIKSIDKRKAFIAKGIEDAQKAEAQLAQAQQAYDGMIREAQLKRDSILREAAEQKERMLSDARELSLAEGRRLTELAKKDAEAEKQKAIRSFHNEIAFLSVQMSEQILRKKLESNEEQKTLIDRFLDEIDDKQL